MRFDAQQIMLNAVKTLWTLPVTPLEVEFEVNCLKKGLMLTFACDIDLGFVSYCLTLFLSVTSITYLYLHTHHMTDQPYPILFGF